MATSSKPADHKWVKSGMRKSRGTCRERQTCNEKKIRLSLVPSFIEAENRRESYIHSSGLKSPSVLRRWDFYFTNEVPIKISASSLLCGFGNRGAAEVMFRNKKPNYPA